MQGEDRNPLQATHLFHKLLQLVLVNVCQSASRREVQGFPDGCGRSVDVILHRSNAICQDVNQSTLQQPVGLAGSHERQDLPC